MHWVIDGYDVREEPIRGFPERLDALLGSRARVVGGGGEDEVEEGRYVGQLDEGVERALRILECGGVDVGESRGGEEEGWGEVRLLDSCVDRTS